MMRRERRAPAKLLLTFVFAMAFVASLPAAARETFNFNPDWKFTKADPTNAFAIAFDDHDWTNVAAPHTYNDTDTFDDWSLSGHRGEQNQWGGRTWYRKSFTLPADFSSRKVFVEFEAVRQFAEVYLNGHRLGISRTGFTPFGFDLTPHLKWGQTNVLAVMCDNRFMKDPWVADGGGGKLAALAAKFNAEIPEDVATIAADQIPWNNPHWHPAHGGIFRNVFLHVTDPLHITLPLYSFLRTAGPYVYATEVSARSAKVQLQLPIQNERGAAERVEVVARVLDANGKEVLTLKPAGQTDGPPPHVGGYEVVEIPAGQTVTAEFGGLLEQPMLWGPARPALYQLNCEIRVAGRIVDSCVVDFGIRTVRWDAQSGCFINGHHLKLHGWGQKPTDEWPGLGAAQPDWLHFLTLQLMRDAGGNFVRWGHCAGGPASIAACDRLGLLVDQPGVDGESDTRGAAWKIRAAAFRDVLIYYRNHPSILIWEGGNQKVSREHAQELHELVEKYDPHGGRAFAHRRADAITAEVMDVGIGTEGGREIARLPVIEGEYNREESPRRVWDDASPPGFGYPEAKGQTYDLTSEQFAVNQVAQYVRKMGAPDHCGGANWIFSDSTSGGRVACEVARAGGEVDGVRLPKEAYYVCRAMFRADPQVHIIGHWTYPAGTRKNIYVAANGEAVELFVNGKSLGRGTGSDRYLFTFKDVTWEPGEIKAVSYVGNEAVATDVRTTTSAAVALKLTAITGPEGLMADGSDIALIDAEAVDEHGARCPTFSGRVEFDCSGPAVWRGGYNSGRTNSINGTSLDLECGINRVAVRATQSAGQIQVGARSAVLKSASVSLQSHSLRLEGQLARQLPQLSGVRRLAGQWDAAYADTMPILSPQTSASTTNSAGRFVVAFSYSGPATHVTVATDAQAGKRIYTDRDLAFSRLPESLQGADYVMTANEDRDYSAVDLMQFAVKAGTTISLAHDDRLPRPEWLTRLFQPTEMSLVIEGRVIKIFQRRSTVDESLTLGSNAEQPGIRSSLMYVVFVNGIP